MKNITVTFLAVICLIIASASLAFAQNASPTTGTVSTGQPAISGGKNIITFAPLGIFNKLRFRYERVVTKSLTLGAQVSYYYQLYPGIQAVAVGRWYFADKGAPFGLYLMGQAGAAYHNAKESKNELYTYGGVFGAGIGYQGALDKKKSIVFDIYIGGKKVVAGSDWNTYLKNGNGVSQFAWEVTGPASFVNCGINVGYRF